MRKTTIRFYLVLAVLFTSGQLALPPCAESAETQYDLFVYSHHTASLLRFDGATGAYKGIFPQPPPVWDYLGMALGPDGLLYVNTASQNKIHIFNPASGGYLGLFTSGFPLQHNIKLAFRPDGYLYVANRDGNNIIRYNAETGAFVDVFVPPGSGGLDWPRSMVWTDENHLLVSSWNSHNVLSYDATTGDFIAEFVEAHSGGLSIPRGMTLGPDRQLYVCSQETNAILRYSVTNGSFIDAFVPSGRAGLSAPTFLAFAPDGNLLVSSTGSDQVLRFNGSTGEFLNVFIPKGSGGLRAPVDLLFYPTDSNPQTNAAPSPPSIALVPTSPSTLDDIICEATGSIDPEGEEVFYQYSWAINGQVVDVTESTLAHELTKRGDLVEARVRASDGARNSDTVKAYVTVVNTPPTAPVIRILPERPRPKDGLAAYFDEFSFDPDDDQILYVFEWYEKQEGQEDWTLRPELSGNLPPLYEKGEPEISHLYTQIAESWRLDVTALDVVTDETDFSKQTSFDFTHSKASHFLSIGGTGSDIVTILADLDGNSELDSMDILLLSLNWHKSKMEVDSSVRSVFFEEEAASSDAVDDHQLLSLIKEIQ